MELYNTRKEINNGKSIYDLPLKVTFYARVSSEKDEQKNSLSNQIFYFENHIKEVSNWTYVEGYVDEGISGTSVNKRDAFKRMIADSKKGKFDLILTKEVTRFARNTVDSISYTQELLANGVGVFFQSDNINTLYSDSELRLTIMASIAQDELRKLSERVKFGMKRSIEQKHVLGNNVIYGYNKNNCKLEIDEEEAKFVREIFELYSTGNYGVKKLAKILYEKGYTSRDGNMLNQTTLTRMLRNPKYKGYYCTNTIARLDYKNSKQLRLPQKEWKVFECKDRVPPIVSEELWNRCNEILNSRSSFFKEKHVDSSIFQNRYAFTSLLYCPEHDVPVTFRRVAGEKRVNRPTWACNCYIRQGLKACQSPILVEKELFDILKNAIKEYVDNKEDIVADLLKRYEEMNFKNSYEHDIKKCEDKIKEIKKKKDKLLELVINEYIDNEEFANRNEVMNNQIEQEQEKIKEMENYKKKLEDYKRELKRLNEEISSELDFENNIDEYIKLLIEKIIVYKIDGDRKKVRLEIFFKLGENKNILYDLNKESKEKYLLGGNHVGCRGHWGLRIPIFFK